MPVRHVFLSSFPKLSCLQFFSPPHPSHRQPQSQPDTALSSSLLFGSESQAFKMCLVEILPFSFPVHCNSGLLLLPAEQGPDQGKDQKAENIKAGLPTQDTRTHIRNWACAGGMRALSHPDSGLQTLEGLIPGSEPRRSGRKARWDVHYWLRVCIPVH